MSLPASNWVHDTVSALAYSLAQPHAGSPELQAPFNDLTQFILRQHANLPDYLRTPMRAATLIFDASGFVKRARRFHRQPPDQRQRQIAAWKNARGGFQRDLIRYFESLAMLALYSRPEHQPPTRRESWSSRFSVFQDDKLKLELQPTESVLDAPANELRAEIVVVGSGPGGAITACLLAEAGRDVLLIEEGQFLPLESCAPFSRDELQQKYRNGGQTVALGRNKIAYVEGCCVGGGSEINSGLYHRTPPDILERWRKEFQVEALCESDLNAHFENCERDLSVSRLPGEAPAAALKLRDGATRLGWKSLEIPRWFRHGPTAEPTLNPSQGGEQSPGRPVPLLGGVRGGFSGERQSMTQTYVPRFMRAGGRLLARTRANRLRQNGAGWIVEATHRLAGGIRGAGGAPFPWRGRG